MEVSTDTKPRHRSHRLGPIEKEEKEVQEIGKSVAVDSQVSASGRPADSMYDRRKKIPLQAQLMMASGPMNGPEVAYYPWENDQECDAQAMKGTAVQEKKKTKEQEKKDNEAMGVVAL